MDRLIIASMDVFARRGFDGAATRDLARAANVTLSAISYHFGGKAELYRAAAERAADIMAVPLKTHLAQAAALVAARATPKDCQAELQRLVASVADIMLAPGHDYEIATRFSMRELVVPGPGSQIVTGRIVEPIVSAAIALLRVICGPAHSQGSLALRAIALFGPITLYRILHNQSLGLMTTVENAAVQRDIHMISHRVVEAMVAA